VPRRKRLTAERRFARWQALKVQRLTRHALGLAAIAGALVDLHDGCVEGAGVVIQRMPAPAGLFVWDVGYGRELLHVDGGGRVLYYERGAWEHSLLQLVAADLARPAGGR
jgi:hypothetical protein